MDEAETMDKDLITAMFENGVTSRKGRRREQTMYDLPFVLL
jgi:hypothetical protein